MIMENFNNSVGSIVMSSPLQSTRRLQQQRQQHTQPQPQQQQRYFQLQQQQLQQQQLQQQQQQQQLQQQQHQQQQQQQQKQHQYQAKQQQQQKQQQNNIQQQDQILYLQQKRQQQHQLQQQQQQQYYQQQSGTSIRQFKKLRVIGRGAYGLCALYQDLRSELNEKVVIKSVSLECRNESEKKVILSEAQLLRQLSHPNIVHLRSSFIELEQLFIVMEYASGGTMERLIQERGGCALGQDLVLYYFTQVTLAMHYIHSRKIMHRDLKTPNIFLNRKRTIVKVGDFGISKELNTREVASTVIGTANYLSPEICEGRAYDLKSDIWAMGCVLYELVELCKAFDGDSFPSIVLNITRAKHRPFTSTTSPEMKQLISKMLHLDEHKRPTTKKILVDSLIMKKWYEVHMELGRINPTIEECTRETYLIRKTNTDNRVVGKLPYY